MNLTLLESHEFDDWLLRTSVQVAVLVGAVLLVTKLAGRRVSPGCRHALWLLVAVRLALPALPSSPASAFNLFDHALDTDTVAASAVATTEPETGWIVTKEPMQMSAAQVVAQDAAPHASEWDWRDLVVLVWAAGVVAFLARVVVANILFARRIRRGAGVDDAGVLALLCSCQRAMGVRTTVRLIATDAVRGPALWGLTHPTLLIPPAMLWNLSRQDLRFVFLHELAHLKRADIAADWCLAVLHALHWFNPAVWLALSRLRAERELSRDAMVLAVTNAQEERGYGQTILKLVQTISHPALRPGVVGILEEKSELKRRIAMIAGFDRNVSRGRGLTIALALLIGSVLLTDRRAADAAAPTEAQPAERIIDKPLPPATRTRHAEEAAGAKEEQADRQIADRLEKRLPEIRFSNTAFQDAIDFLRDVSGADISVNWAALEKAGIDRNAPVTTRLKDVKLSRALEHILHNVGGGKIDFVAAKGVITVSTIEDLDRDKVTQVYDLRDLLVVDEKDEKKADAIREALVAELTALIQETIAPDSWDTKGGKTGSISHRAGQLAVTHTARHQAQVKRLLEQVRESRAVQISVEARFISTKPDVIKKFKLEPREGDAQTFMDAEQVNAFLRAVQGDVDGEVLTAPRLTLMNGHRGEITIGEEVAYLAGFKEVNGQFQPEPASYLREGTSMELTATVSADRKYVTMDARSTVTKFIEITEEKWVKAPPGRDDLLVQVPKLAVQEYKAIVSVLDSGTLAAVLRPKGAAAKEARPDAAVTVMLIKPRIVIQREE